MTSKLIPNPRTVVLLVIAAVAGSFAQPTEAQMTGKIAGQPIAVGYMRNLTEASNFKYMKKLAARMNYESTIFDSVPDNVDINDLVPRVDEQISGEAWYMVQGLLPSFEPIYFRKVADVADAKRMLKARETMQTGTAMSVEVKDEGDDCFQFVQSWSHEFEAPGDGGVQDYVDQKNERAMTGSGNTNTSYAVVEKDGKEMVKQTSQWTEQYRFHDNMLFSGGGEHLLEMDLPAASELTRGVQGGKDMGLDVYFDRIPSGIKTLGWNLLTSTAGTMMQQRDEEEATQADVRKTSVQLGLDVVKALMFDIQEAHGWLRFATEDDQSIRGQLLFETRRNAELQKQLETASSGISRFAPILQDEAVVTLHTCITLPEASPMFQAVAAWLPGAVQQEVSSDAAIVRAAEKLALTLIDLADTPTIEACIKAGWSEASDGAFYGGLRVGNNEGLLEALVTLLQSTNPPEGIMEFTETDGLSVLHFTIPEREQEFAAKSFGLHISDIYVTQAASCLWFAAGNENAIQMMKASISRCESGGSAGRAPLLTAEVDGDAWLALPQDDPVGIASLLLYLDENEAWFPPALPYFSMGQSGKPTPLLQRCVDLGGNHRASLRIVADRSAVKIDAEIGEVIGNYMLVRQMDAQDRKRRQAAEYNSQDQVSETKTIEVPQSAE